MATRVREVVWAESARDALQEVIEYIGRDSRANANRVLEEAIRTASRLDTMAKRGRVVPELSNPAVREVFVYRYRLFYEIEIDRIVILAFSMGRAISPPGDRTRDGAQIPEPTAMPVSLRATRRAVEALKADIAATLTLDLTSAVDGFVANRRRFAFSKAQFVEALVEDVQQYFHDTFVDTTWPACPRHPNHPLWFADGWWCCGREQIARLGGLGALRS